MAWLRAIDNMPDTFTEWAISRTIQTFATTKEGEAVLAG
jgi:hypothetical protein